LPPREGGVIQFVLFGNLGKKISTLVKFSFFLPFLRILLLKNAIQINYEGGLGWLLKKNMGKKKFPYSKLWGNKFVPFEEYIPLDPGPFTVSVGLFNNGL
jgi:hypothetical protein